MTLDNKRKIIAFDLDDVLCTRPSGIEHLGEEKYKYCIPIQNNIELLNSYHKTGLYKIIIYTARGMSQFEGNVDRVYERLYQFTYEQLVDWGVSFDELIMGKIHFDVLVDDKAINAFDEDLVEGIMDILG